METKEPSLNIRYTIYMAKIDSLHVPIPCKYKSPIQIDHFYMCENGMFHHHSRCSAWIDSNLGFFTKKKVETYWFHFLNNKFLGGLLQTPWRRYTFNGTFMLHNKHCGGGFVYQKGMGLHCKDSLHSLIGNLQGKSI